MHKRRRFLAGWLGIGPFVTDLVRLGIYERWTPFVVIAATVIVVEVFILFRHQRGLYTRWWQTIILASLVIGIAGMFITAGDSYATFVTATSGGIRYGGALALLEYARRGPIPRRQIQEAGA